MMHHLTVGAQNTVLIRPATLCIVEAIVFSANVSLYDHEKINFPSKYRRKNEKGKANS